MEGFVAGEVALGGGAAADAGGGGGGLAGEAGGGGGGGEACERGAGVGRGFWGWGLRGAGVVEGVGDDAGGVEVGEHFWTEGVDHVCDFLAEGCAPLAELDEGVCGCGVETEDEGSEGFEDVHAGFAEAEGGEGDGDEEGDAGDDYRPERYPFWDVALDAVFVGPVGQEGSVKGIE